MLRFVNLWLKTLQAYIIILMYLMDCSLRFFRGPNRKCFGFLSVSLITIAALTYYTSILLSRTIYESIHLRTILRFANNTGPSWALAEESISPHSRSLFGVIWPRSDNALPEVMDRIEEQKRFIDKFWPITGPNGTRAPIYKTKVILKLGTFNFENFRKGQSFFVDEGCPINSCVITDDYSVRESADALVMSQFTRDHLPLFLPKPVHQIWIAQHKESPRMNKIDTELVKDLINWTASYRKDSTIPLGYGHYIRDAKSCASSSEPTQSTTTTRRNYAAGRTRQVAWVVSNCYAITNNRMQYGAELAKYISIDVFGRCGRLNHSNCAVDGVVCYKWISKHYKFYLAFENSSCKDYITEKFYRNALHHNVLPVVMGGVTRDDYGVAAPPHSYIHVDDFSSPLELAQFLHVLDKNDTLYNSYFEWKTSWKSAYFNQRYWCRMCMMLHLAEKQGYVHWYTDYTKWWTGVCRQSH